VKSSTSVQVNEREVFLAKQTETISATQIRGKCSVSLLHKVPQHSAILASLYSLTPRL
jgi:hypothetical protein